MKGHQYVLLVQSIKQIKYVYYLVQVVSTAGLTNRSYPVWAKVKIKF